MRNFIGAAAIAAFLAFGGAPALAEEPKPDAKVEAAKVDLPPLPADASVKQVTHVAGKTLSYTATVGSLPVRDEKGKKIAEVVFTAYVLDGAKDPKRPITFAFNGGPGAASVYLNLGAIGPKRVQFGAEGDNPSDMPTLVDNPATWLDFTDMVFIDPVGTGFSRSLTDDADAKKRFFEVKSDVQYLSRIVYDWLLKNQRLSSPKYVVGESYGGFRAPAIAYELQSQLGVGPSGVIMVSPFLDAHLGTGGDVSPMPFVTTLPSMAAALFERQGALSRPENLAEVEAYARGDFATDLMKGADPAALRRVIDKVAVYTGLPLDVVEKAGGRIDIGLYLRERYRTTGLLASVYDSNVTAPDPFPWAPQQRANDPILASIIAPTTSAMVDFMTRTVGWKVEGRYNALSSAVNQAWEKDWYNDIESVTDLRQAMGADRKLKVLIVHGYNDLSCPYFASRLIVDQVPKSVAADRLSLALYPGGHMFYSRTGSQDAFRRDVMRLYGAL